MCQGMVAPCAGMAGALGIQVMSDGFGRRDRQTGWLLGREALGATKAPP
jgi:hypothetical protein